MDASEKIEIEEASVRPAEAESPASELGGQKQEPEEVPNPGETVLVDEKDQEAEVLEIDKEIAALKAQHKKGLAQHKKNLAQHEKELAQHKVMARLLQHMIVRTHTSHPDTNHHHHHHHQEAQAQYRKKLAALGAKKKEATGQAQSLFEKGSSTGEDGNLQLA